MILHLREGFAVRHTGEFYELWHDITEFASELSDWSTMVADRQAGRMWRPQINAHK
jgi:hypothetical protein